jgi:RNA polymerase sigma-70 factor (ECF subfamily)
MTDSFSGFETWYSDCHARVLAVLTVVSGNADAASEATDEAFARALARWRRVRTMKSPTGWTYRVALNELRRRIRRQEQEVQLSLKASDASKAEQDPLLWFQVLEAIRPLTARQRTVLALCYIADLPQREVASVLHVSRSTVASTLADAKAAVLNRDSVPIDNCEDMEGSHDAN